AQEEAIELMMPAHNLLKPADGSPITLPNKEMALGSFYLTSIDERLRRETLPAFSDTKEAQLAFSLGKIALREPILVRIEGKVLETTIGRTLFNDKLPEKVPYINSEVKAATIKEVITRAMVHLTEEEVARLIDTIKEIGFFAATISGISVSTFDLKMLGNKNELIREGIKKIQEIEDEYNQGLITLAEQKRLSNNVWLELTDKMANL